MTYHLVGQNIEELRRDTYLRIYNFLYRRLKRMDLERFEEIRPLVWATYIEVYRSLVAGSYGIEVEYFGPAVSAQVDSVAREFAEYLKTQSLRVKKEVSRYSVGEEREEIDRRYELLRGLPATYARPFITRRKSLRSSGKRPRTVERYSDHYTASRRRLRSAAIAKTESVRWVEVAQRMFWLDAQRQGRIPGAAMVIWLASMKEQKMCKRCRNMHNQMVLIGENFVTMEGNLIASAPLHPHCECKNFLVM